MKTYGRIIGVLFLLSMICGGFGEVYVPSQLIVSGDAAATARNLQANDWLFRVGFASYLVEALCDIALALLFYYLLRPVRRDVALLAAFFGILSTALFAVAEMFYFSASLVLRNADYLRAFSPEQRDVLAMLALRMYGLGGGIFMAFYGIATLLRGVLIFRSGYLPKFLGVLMVIAGAGFIVKNFTLVLAPAYSSDLFLLPMFAAGLALTVWFLTKGVSQPAAL
jgi:hypothetical protein